MITNLFFTVVVLGLQTPALTVIESETFSVCVIITGGSLELDISIGLKAENSSSAGGNSTTSACVIPQCVQRSLARILMAIVIV